MVADRLRHPLFARVYSRLRPAMDRQGAGEHRRRLVAGLAGRVVEVGAGDGGNFAHYPGGVTRVLAVEPEPYLRALAERRAGTAAVPVEVVDGRAERLPVADATADAVVASLVLCSVSDQATALRELYRVLRPGGELRFFEHVAAETPGVLRAVQGLADRTVWPVLCGGCHTGRDTVTAITAAGFVVEEIDRFRFPPGQRSPAAPHVLGTARRPVTGAARVADV